MFGEVSKHLSVEMNEIRLINQTSKISKMVTSPKLFEITLSIWYANSSGAQALWIGKGYGALGGRIRKKVGQNLVSAIGLQKGLKTIVPNI